MEQTISVSLDGAREDFAPGVKVADVVSRLDPSAGRSVLAAMRGGECMELTETLHEDTALKSVTYRDDEGRRIYERSLRYVLLLCVRRLYPHWQMRVLHSVGYGVYLQAMGTTITHAQIAALEKEMRLVIAQDIPFERAIWRREDAIRYFEDIGQLSTAHLLRDRPSETIAMYTIGEMHDYYYGAMLPSTGYIDAFELLSHFPGLVIQYPDPQTPDVPAPYLPRPKFLRVFAQSRQWCDVLGVSTAWELNAMIRAGGLREFIRVNEALQDKSIARIADEIASRGARIVLIFGPSCSGKTTFCHRLAVHLRVLGLHPKQISLDDFYRNADTQPLEADGKPDFEHIEALDVGLLSRCLEGLIGGRRVEMPRFDFTTGKRRPESVPMEISENEPLLVEGIHALNPRITSQLPEQLTYGVYVSALPCINLDDHNRIRTTDVRLLRRIVRDAQFRNMRPEKTIDMWPKVRQGEERWIFPNQERADVLVNTSLHYELPLLKPLAYDALRHIRHDQPEYLVARRLLKMLNYFAPVDSDVLREVPPLSILREFIGDCSFYDRH